MKIPPPEGINDDDFEAIEAAVMETVRGRWFLAEFLRRHRLDEMHTILAAIGKLEILVAEQQRALPADPSIRLLVQRLMDVSQQLDGLAQEMRMQGQDETLCGRIEAQARAVGSLLRVQSEAPALRAEAEPASVAAPLPAIGIAPMAAASAGSIEPAAPEPAAMPIADPEPAQDPRLGALTRIDRLPDAEKLVLFS